jgi:hypothetical protein
MARLSSQSWLTEERLLLWSLWIRIVFLGSLDCLRIMALELENRRSPRFRVRARDTQCTPACSSIHWYNRRRLPSGRRSNRPGMNWVNPGSAANSSLLDDVAEQVRLPHALNLAGKVVGVAVVTNRSIKLIYLP